MIVVCGEALIDLVPAGPDPAAGNRAAVGGAAGDRATGDRATDGRAATGSTWRAAYGGGPANTAVALARLGTRAAFAGRLSGDTFGRQLRGYLLASGVDLSLSVAADEPTTLAVVAVDEHGGAEYQFYVNGTADWQWSPAELPGQLPTGTTGLHVGSLVTIMSPGATVLRDWIALQRDRVVVTYDVNVRAALLPDRDSYRRRIAGWLDVAHVVKASHDDLVWLYPDREPLDIARGWIDEHDVALVLVTLGPYGAVAAPRGLDPVRVPGIHIDVVDTIGAGDTFTAGFLHWLASHDALRIDELRIDALGRADLSAALRFAAAAAAIVCTREGAQPPTFEEVGQLLDTMDSATP